MEKLSLYEKLEMSSMLHNYSSLFYKFWDIGTPYYYDKIPTAGIFFDPKTRKELFFAINKSFWEGLTPDQKAFVVCHEMLHILLDHQKRSEGLNHELANVAQDIVINHQLVDSYGFLRKAVDPDSKYCWIETCFPETHQNVHSGQSFMYYYNLLLEDAAHKIMECLGSHQQSNTSDKSEGEQKKPEQTPELGESPNIEDILEKIKDDLEAKEELEKLEKESEGYSDKLFSVDKQKVKPKKKWETVIKKWVQKTISNSDNQEDTWVGKNRRFAFLGDDLILPNSLEQEHREKNKVVVWFLQDTSGSCIGYANRFFKAAQSIPSKKIDVRIACFDTSVYPTSLDDPKIRGGGGNNSHCMERYIQQTIKKEGIKYPDAVFLMSDGHVFGGVECEQPDRWYWFMPPSHTTKYLHPDMKVFKLADFE